VIVIVDPPATAGGTDLIQLWLVTRKECNDKGSNPFESVGITPKAFANFSPGFKRSENPG